MQLPQEPGLPEVVERMLATRFTQALAAWRIMDQVLNVVSKNGLAIFADGKQEAGVTVGDDLRRTSGVLRNDRARPASRFCRPKRAPVRYR